MSPPIGWLRLRGLMVEPSRASVDGRSARSGGPSRLILGWMPGVRYPIRGPAGARPRPRIAAGLHAQLRPRHRRCGLYRARFAVAIVRLVRASTTGRPRPGLAWPRATAPRRGSPRRPPASRPASRTDRCAATRCLPRASCSKENGPDSSSRVRLVASPALDPANVLVAMRASAAGWPASSEPSPRLPGSPTPDPVLR